MKVLYLRNNTANEKKKDCEEFLIYFKWKDVHNNKIFV